MHYLGIINLFEIIVIIILLVLFALIDIIKSEFKGNDKMMWLLIVLFTGFIGAILYFVVGRKQRIIK